MPDTPDTSTPPWGDDFDASRAWSLIQSLRQDVKDAKADSATERKARKTAEDALAANDADGKIAAAEQRAKAAESALWTSKALVEYPALKGFEDLLGGDSAEAVLEKAKRLASLGGTPPAPDATGDGDAGDTDGDTPPAEPDATPQSTAPTPDLVPGHGGESTAPFDPVALAKSIRG